MLGDLFILNDKGRFIDNGDGTITDFHLNLMWKKTDSFQDIKKWVNWFKSNDYANKMNQEGFCGHSDWRLPSEEEAWSLFDTDKISQDKYGDDIYLDPVFQKGSVGITWTFETKDSAALVIQYEDGGRIWPSQYAYMNMAARLVRDIKKINKSI